MKSKRSRWRSPIDIAALPPIEMPMIARKVKRRVSVAPASAGATTW
jgi:hypothetical protein